MDIASDTTNVVTETHQVDEPQNEIIGYGGISQVYKPHTNITCFARSFVIKRYLTGSAKTEFDILKSLNHPGIVKVFELINTREYSMEEGFHIRDHLTESELLDVLNDIIPAIKYIHSRGILHMDIRSGNILKFNNSGAHYKLIDFSLAHSSRDMSKCINSWHMYPEEFNADPHNIGPAVDIWMLGMFCLDSTYPIWMCDVKDSHFYTTINKHIALIRSEKLRSLMYGFLSRDPTKRLKY